MKKLKAFAALAATVIFAAGSLYLLQRLLMPKYAESAPEGAFIAEYYSDPKGHDVIILGDCEVYSSFSPVALWRDYGITSYVRGSAEQYIFQSYYLLEDTLMYEKPRVVVLGVQALQYEFSRSEAYNRMTLDGMGWSRYKIGAVLASMTEGESFLDYLFPLLRYHSRWSELTAEDFEYTFSRKKVTHSGYYMRADVLPAGALPGMKPLGDYSFGERAWEYLDKIAALCRERSIGLLLVKAPGLYPYWYAEWDAQIAGYAAENGIRYVNLSERTEEMGIDYARDTYDGGQHLNLYGAEKCTRWLGELLSRVYGVPDRRGDRGLEKVWAEKTAAYDSERAALEEKYGMEG